MTAFKASDLQNERMFPLDKKNTQILELLTQNSRISWQDIGKKVHITGQAVAARVRQLEDDGTIESYTICQGNRQEHFITVFMNDARFDAFEAYLAQNPRVLHAYKTSGEGCYHLVIDAPNLELLESFLNSLLKYARYRVSTAIRTIK